MAVWPRGQPRIGWLAVENAEWNYGELAVRRILLEFLK